MRCVPGSALQLRAFRDSLRLWFDCTDYSGTSLKTGMKRPHETTTTRPSDGNDDGNDDIEFPSVCR